MFTDLPSQVPPASAAAASQWAAGRRVAAAARRANPGHSGYVISSADYWKPISSDRNWAHPDGPTRRRRMRCGSADAVRSQAKKAGSQVVRADTYDVT